MPELPEVETIVRGLDKRITGDTIESVWIGSRPQVLKSPAAAIAAALEGRKVVRVHRAGKHIVVDLTGAGGASETSERTPGLGSSLTGTALSRAMCTAFGCTVCACCSRGNMRGIVAGDQPNAGDTLAAAVATSAPVASARQVWTASLAS